MNFSERLKLLRKEKDLTQDDLSKIIGMKRSTIAGYETKNKQPDYDTLTKIADFFNVSTDYLLGSSDKRNPEESTEKEKEEDKPFIENAVMEISMLAKKNNIIPDEDFVEFIKQQAEIAMSLIKKQREKNENTNKLNNK